MFLINLKSNETIYEQIKAQIIDFIDNGVLKPDDKLPSVRSLALDLGINPNTVMKAYQELEDNGYIYTLNKKGAFISSNIKQSNKHDQDAKYLINQLKDKGYTSKQLKELIDEVYRKEK